MIEKIDGHWHYCGHASIQFKSLEQYYRKIYKEILALKYGIQKFEFHLIGHRFLVQLNNSSFVRVLEFKNKALPNP